MRFHNERLAYTYGLEHRPEYATAAFDDLTREQSTDTVMRTVGAITGT